MLLSSDLGEHQTIPKEYLLDVTSESVNNTFVFTEQDLPGFKSKSRQKFDPSNANMPARLTRPSYEKSKQPWDPNKRFTPYYRKAIPSEFDSMSGCTPLILVQ
jgi:transcription initiation factor TFIIF subunit beta